MPIASSDLIERLSGGASNSDPNLSLGGVKSSTAVTDNVTHNLWDVVSSTESNDGDTEYRCIYLHNNHASLTLQNAKVWVSTNTGSASTTVEIGAGSAAINATEQTVANENTAPTSVTFSAAANEGAAVTLGNIPNGQHKAIWIKRIITAAAAAANDDTYVLTYAGDTAA
jgi:hypothetical protein